MAKLSGKGGSIALGGTNYPMSKWDMEVDGEDPEVTNFSSGGQYEDLAGIDKALINAEGPYDSGNMPMTRGTVYTLTLRMSNAVTASVPGRLKKFKLVTDTKDAVRIQTTFQQTGPFTAALS